MEESARKNTEVISKKLSWFQDQKLGLMMHWGTYSQLGMMESWPLSDEDAAWSRRWIDWERDPRKIREDIFSLQRGFYPIRFQPDVWADMAARNGFKYLIFTTKHHDGFCLWDTKETDYKVTSPDCPFCTHRYANIAKCLFDEMRKRGLGIGAYFSKGDWHSPAFWDADAAFTSRNPTYSVAEQPARWAEFVRFSHAQMRELAEDLGPLDILWLDGGWLHPRDGYDMRMAECVRRLREHTPDLLVVDRYERGACEDYVTPEKIVPDVPPEGPWESCFSVGSSFSFRYDDTWKTPEAVIRLLLDVVSKGGNLALNIAPQPDGRLPAPGLRVLNALGDWLRVNGEGIYGTRPIAPYRAGDFALTQKPGAVYCFRMYKPGEAAGFMEHLPALNGRVRRIELLGEEGELTFTQSPSGIEVDLRRDRLYPFTYAHCFKCEMEETPS